MSEIALRFSGVAKYYGRAAVLRDVSFEVARGEFFGLVGVNGAGKTTLLKCMLDFCDTDNGNIEIFGTSHRLTAARSRLAFLPERFNPPYFLTGEDFIRYVLELQATAYDRGAAERMLHALADVAEVCDRMAVMHAGGLRFAGTPAALRRQFATDDLEQAFLRCIEAVSPAN